MRSWVVERMWAASRVLCGWRGFWGYAVVAVVRGLGNGGVGYGAMQWWRWLWGLGNGDVGNGG